MISVIIFFTNLFQIRNYAHVYSTTKNAFNAPRATKDSVKYVKYAENLCSNPRLCRLSKEHPSSKTIANHHQHDYERWHYSKLLSAKSSAPLASKHHHRLKEVNTCSATQTSTKKQQFSPLDNIFHCSTAASSQLPHVKKTSQRTIRKFMKGLLRQKLESIAGKVLAVASAAGLPLKQTATRGASGGGGGEGEGGGGSEAKKSEAEKVGDSDDDDSEQEEDKWDKDGYVEVIGGVVWQWVGVFVLREIFPCLTVCRGT